MNVNNKNKHGIDIGEAPLACQYQSRETSPKITK